MNSLKFHLPLSQVLDFRPLFCINCFISLNKGKVGLGSDICCSSESKECISTLITCQYNFFLLPCIEEYFIIHIYNKSKSVVAFTLAIKGSYVLNTSGNIPHTSLPLHLGKSPCIALLPFLPQLCIQSHKLPKSALKLKYRE